MIAATGHFNPRSREGSDGVRRGVGAIQGISIHAPVKGATLLSRAKHIDINFNPRSREGSDPETLLPGTGEQGFQSTLP